MKRVKPIVRVVAAVSVGYVVLFVALLLTLDLDMRDPISDAEAARDIGDIVGVLGVSVLVSLVVSAILVVGSQTFDRDDRVWRQPTDALRTGTDRYRTVGGVGFAPYRRQP